MSDDDDSDDTPVNKTPVMKAVVAKKKTPVKKTPVKKVAAPVFREDESSSEEDSDDHEDIVLLREMTEECDSKDALRKEADLRKELIKGFHDDVFRRRGLATN